jgi:hypothetical protein
MYTTFLNHSRNTLYIGQVVYYCFYYYYSLYMRTSFWTKKKNRNTWWNRFFRVYQRNVKTVGCTLTTRKSRPSLHRNINGVILKGVGIILLLIDSLRLCAVHFQKVFFNVTRLMLYFMNVKTLKIMIEENVFSPILNPVCGTKTGNISILSHTYVINIPPSPSTTVEKS